MDDKNRDEKVPKGYISTLTQKDYASAFYQKIHASALIQKGYADIPTHKQQNNLEILLKTYKSYVDDPSYVYKKCVNTADPNYDRCWLVIMRKNNDTNMKTNESRSCVVDSRYAKFRANELKVIEIVNVNAPHITVPMIINCYAGISMVYKVGEMVVAPEYCEFVDIICSAGIHYFKTLDAAYFYEFSPDKHIGNQYVWDCNGKILRKFEYEYYQNGALSSRIYYNTSWGMCLNFRTELHQNGMITKCTEFYSNDVKKVETIYDKDAVEKLQANTYTETLWYSNGRKQKEEKYIDGQIDGTCTEWYFNGIKKSEKIYVNGKKFWKWTYWNPDGKKELVCEYLNGEIYCAWNANGDKISDSRIINQILNEFDLTSRFSHNERYIRYDPPSRPYVRYDSLSGQFVIKNQDKQS